MYYALLLLSVLGIAGNFSLGKVYQKSVPSGAVEALRRSVWSAPLMALMFFLMSGCRISFNSFTLLMSALMAVVGILSTVVSFKGYVHGSIAVFTLFQMAGGMLLPFVYGIYYGNEVTPARVIGIAVMLLALLLPLLGGGGLKMSKKFLWLCVAIFFLNGSISILSYIYSNSALSMGANSFLVLKSLLFGAVSLGMYLFWRRKEPAFKPDGKTFRKLLLLVVAMTVLDGLSYYLQLISAEKLPAVALYPMVTGGAVIFTAIAGRVFFKEKLGKGTVYSIVAALVATVLFMF